MAKRSPSWKGARGFIISRPVRRLALIVIVVGVLIWQTQRLVSMGIAIRYGLATTWNSLLETFGWGLAVVGIAAAIVVWLLFADTRSISRWWRQLLSAIPFGLAIFGLLAFFVYDDPILSRATLGGEFGQWVIGAPDAGGVARVVVLTLIGLALAAPSLIWRGICAVGRGARRVPELSRRGYRTCAAWIRGIRRGDKRPPALTPTQIPLTPVTEDTPSAEMESEIVAPAAEISPEPAPASATEEWQKLRATADELGKAYQKSAPIATTTGWQLPPIDILDNPPQLEFGEADIEQRARRIEEALASYGVEAKVVQINVGPVVTQFGVEPGWDRKYKEVKERDDNGNLVVRHKEVARTRVKVERITSLANDLALALASPSIRIEAPVPGKAMVGIEVPNTIVGMVTLRKVVESTAFQKLMGRTRLPLALGKGAGGEALVADLAKMPHLLIAGATGSGKTVCLNSVILSLLMCNTPQELQIMLVDPKRVELTAFNSLPHLAAPVIVDSEKAVGMLNWLNQEMDDRYRKMAVTGARNIQAYNKDNEVDPMSYLVVIIDELADLMAARADEVETAICRLAQLARATGIHLVVATQRPSVDVVTGLIKANFPSRISFAVASQVDSRTILDCTGAERLLGRGDMLYLPVEAAKPKRIQGCFVSDQEIERMVYFWNSQQPPEGHHRLIEDLSDALTSVSGVKRVPHDPLLNEARRLAQEHKQISASFLQRQLRVGYPRAARLMDLLHEEDIPESDEGKEI